MKNEITFKKIGEQKITKIRLVVPAPKIMKDKTKYKRKPKHKGSKEW